MDEAELSGRFEGDYHVGTVDWFNRERGFGYVVDDADGEKLFADKLFTLPKRTLLRDGQRVRFRVHAFGKYPPQAVDILPHQDEA